MYIIIITINRHHIVPFLFDARNNFQSPNFLFVNSQFSIHRCNFVHQEKAIYKLLFNYPTIKKYTYEILNNCLSMEQ